MTAAVAGVVGTMMLMSAAAPRARCQRRLAFGSGKHWILIDPATRKIEHLTLPGEHTAIELVASHDGKLIVFTEAEPGDTSLLYKWDRKAGTEPVSIGDSTGYHSDPAFSQDEKWIYFAHNPSSGGGPGRHGPGAYAQIYRVPLSGGHPAKITSGEGCHYLPVETNSGGLYYVHSTCRLIQFIEHPTRRGRPPATFDVGAGAFRNLSTNGRGALLITSELNGIEHISERDTTGRQRSLFSLPASPTRLLVQPSCDGKEVYYMYHDSVWRWRSSKVSKVAAHPEG